MPILQPIENYSLSQHLEFMRKCNPSTCLLACILGLKCFEAEVYLALLDKGFADVDSIAKAVEKNKATVYRALKRLEERGLVVKNYKIVRTGGYKYIYRPVPIDSLRNMIAKRVDELISEIKTRKIE
ncbi:helix-turn-helix domain-containing protein [Archaeoglobus profundus]|nr:helix-turn-helix domain-containing protein [Archaeoglobus profundus]